MKGPLGAPAGMTGERCMLSHTCVCVCSVLHSLMSMWCCECESEMKECMIGTHKIYTWP